MTVFRARSWHAVAVLLGLVLLLGAVPATADTTPQSLPFTQDWTNTGLITTSDDWSGVPGVVGYRGDGMTGTTGVDPQTVVAEGGLVLDVNANQTAPNTFTTGGVTEFHLDDPVVALQGSGTARAPHLVLSFATTGLGAVSVAYNLRDVDGSADNAVQPVALQYRVGGTGDYTNLPAGFVADATTGPSLATLVTPVSVALPADAANQPLVQVRIVTTDAVGSDEWVGIDDIAVTGGAPEPTDPTGIGAANPATVAAGGSTLLTVAVTPGANPASTGLAVSADLGSIGGSATQQLFDDGTNGDATAGDDVFSYQATVASATAAGAKTLPASITDAQGRSGSATIGLTVTSGTPPAGSVVISEVYGGGGNSGATYTHDFVELYNRTASEVSLAGWSVQYASSAGTTWQTTPLGGTIAPGGYYLVRQAAGAGGDLALPSPDALGTIAMAAGAGKVALVSSTTALSGACPTAAAIVDRVGYGGANCFEGSGAAPTLTNTTSAHRAGGGATDTDDNAADFTAGSPDPRGTTDPAPTVTSTIPANGGTDVGLGASIVVSFSEPVGPSGSWFTISCADSGSHSATVTANAGSYRFTLAPDAAFAPHETCTVTIAGAQVSDLDGFDPPDTMAADHVFSFTTADVAVCGNPATRIHAIQGTEALSPRAGEQVAIEGVVVGDFQGPGGFGGFYVQEEDGDADTNPATSEGIFVFSSLPVAEGDVVRVHGTVIEFVSSNSRLTEVTNVSALSVCSTGATVTQTTVTLPVASFSDFERYEGMLVRFTQTLTATETFTLGRFGEVRLAAGGRLYTPTAVTTPGAAATAQADLNSRRSFVLDDGNNQQNIDPTIHPPGGLSAANTLRSGYTVDGLTGVFDERFSVYRVQPLGPVPFVASNPRTAAPEDVGGNLKVASFNVLNYFNGNGSGLEGAAGGFPTPRGANSLFELERQRTKIVSALQTIDADVVGLMEIENDPTPASAIADLVAGLNDAMGAGTYSFVDTGVIGTDEIKVALIYKPGSVTPVGDWKILTAAIDPRFRDDRNRPALAQTFERNGTGDRLTVVVNHLKSKGSSCADIDDPDTGDGQGNCNLTRTRAAQALVDWLATDPTGSGDPNVLIIGDLNAYTFEDPITAIRDAGYENLVARFGGPGAYSYVFDGQAGYLDHALASPTLAVQATGTTDWHINADEPIVLDYNVEFKTANQVETFYAPGPYRASDHDPVIVGLDLAVTFQSLCALTRAYSSSAVVADELCHELAKAEKAGEGGRPKPQQVHLRNYEKKVARSVPAELTADEAATLIRLAGRL